MVLITRFRIPVAYPHGEHFDGQQAKARICEIHRARDSHSTFHVCLELIDSSMLADVTRNNPEPLNNSLDTSLKENTDQRIVDVFVWLLTNESRPDFVDNDD